MTPGGHQHLLLSYRPTVLQSDAVEPEPMQADLLMQSDLGALASFKDIANIADANVRNSWYCAH
eukprot:2502300-Pleurochrysis_carterae.AAC.4